MGNKRLLFIVAFVITYFLVCYWQLFTLVWNHVWHPPYSNTFVSFIPSSELKSSRASFLVDLVHGEQQSPILKSMSIVVDLGTYVFLSWLKNWLSVDEVCCLDTAFCNSIFRPKFLQKLAHCKFSQGSNPTMKPSVRQLEWYASRNLSVVELKISWRHIESHQLVSASKFWKDLASLQIFSPCQNNAKPLTTILNPCVGMKELCFYGAGTVTDTIITVIAERCRCLHILCFRTKVELTATAFGLLAHSLSSLRVFEVTNVSSLDHNLLATLIRNNVHLICLKLRNISTSQFPVTVQALAHSCPKLEILHITNGFWSHEHSLFGELFEKCRQLVDLNFSGSSVTPTELFKTNPTMYGVNITCLDLSSTASHINTPLSLTDSDVQLLCHSCPQLTDLNISYRVDSITVMSCLHIANQLTRLKRIQFKRSVVNSVFCVAHMLFTAMFGVVETMDYKSVTICGQPHTQDNKRYHYDTDLFSTTGAIALSRSCERVVGSNGDNDDVAHFLSKLNRVSTSHVFPPNKYKLPFLHPNCLRTLKVLHLNGNTQAIIREDLAAIIQLCTQLREFGIAWCNLLPSDYLTSLTHRNPHITVLHFTRCLELSFIDYLRIADSLPGLKSLTIDNSNINEKVVSGFLRKCRQLDSLALLNCPFVSAHNVFTEMIQSNVWWLDDVNVNGLTLCDNLSYYQELRNKLGSKAPVVDVVVEPPNITLRSKRMMCSLM